MHLPISFLWSLLCQADKTLLVLGLNFISVTSRRARLAAFPWMSLSMRGGSALNRELQAGVPLAACPSLPLLWVCCSPGSCRVL